MDPVKKDDRPRLAPGSSHIYTKFVHEEYAPHLKQKKEASYAYCKHTMPREVVFELIHQNELNALCNTRTLILCVLNYGILFGLYGYGLFVATTAADSEFCQQIAEWLTVWCSFVIAVGGCVLLLYLMRLSLSTTWRYPADFLGDAQAQVAFVTSRKSLECTVVDYAWVEKLRSAKLKRLSPYFILCGILLWQPGALVFSAFWLTSAQTQLDLVADYGDCGHVGYMTLGIWVFSVVVSGIAAFLYSSIFLILLSMSIQEGIPRMMDAIIDILTGPLDLFHDGAS